MMHQKNTPAAAFEVKNTEKLAEFQKIFLADCWLARQIGDKISSFSKKNIPSEIFVILYQVETLRGHGNRKFSVLPKLN